MSNIVLNRKIRRGLFLVIDRSGHLIKSKSFKIMGDASFSIYLVHMIVLDGLDKFTEINFSNWVLFLFCILAGVITYFLIEKPLTRSFKRFT